jgi:hypothetical protein
MKKKPLSRRYRVKASVQMLELTRAGSSMQFEIFGLRGKLGSITIGRGSFTWVGSHKRKRKTRRINWARFAKMMDDMS